MMNNDYDFPPVFGINRFLWHSLKQAGILNEEPYNDILAGLVPIIGVNRTENFVTLIDKADPGPPFIVYNWSTSQSNQMWFLSTDQIIYLVYGEEETQVRRITRFIVDLFKRFDDSAQEINDYLSQFDRRYTCYNFKAIELTSAQGPLPPDPDVEYGRIESSIALSVDYTYDINDRGMKE